MAKHNLSVADRFWSKVNVRGEDDCWYWTKYKLNSGYGLFSIRNDKHITAHRFSWILSNGEIPDGLEVCHSCENKLCVNPNHLYLANHSENMKDIFIKNLKNKSKDGVIICPMCKQLIDEDTQFLLTHKALNDN